MGFEESRIPPRYHGLEGLNSAEELKRLFETSVLVAGLGAGSPAAIALARMGIATEKNSTLTLADPERVEMRNLSRPPFSYDDAVSRKPKVEAAREIIHSINTKVNVVTEPEGVTRYNVGRLVESADVVIEMIDISKPALTLAVHQECHRWKKPLVTGLDIVYRTHLHVFDYRDADQVTYEYFLGLPREFPSQEFESVNPLAVASQLVIGPQAIHFQNPADAVNFYSDAFFQDENNQRLLLESLDEEERVMVAKLLTGELKHIPQTDSASQLMGTLQSRIVKDLVLGYPIACAPDAISLSITNIIRPKK